MLKQPTKSASSASHDAASVPTAACVGIQRKVCRSAAPTDALPTDPIMEQKSGNLVLGGRVVFLSRSGLHRGILKYVGSVQFDEGEWCGVELDVPDDGCCGGAVNDVEYFRCDRRRGMFVERWKVCREGQEEETKPADTHLPARTLSSPDNETRLPQLKFKSKIPSSLKSKTMKSSSSTAMAPLRVTAVLDVTKSTEGQVHVQTFVDLRGGDGDKIELTEQKIKEAESLITGCGKSGDFSLQRHYSTVKTIRKSQSRGCRPSAHQKVTDPEPSGAAAVVEDKGAIPLFLPASENSGRSKLNQGSLHPTTLTSHGRDYLYKDECSEGYIKQWEQTEFTKKRRIRSSDDKDESSIPNVLSDDTMTLMSGVNSEIEGFQSDNEDQSSTGCCIKSFISLYNHPVIESHSVAADYSGNPAKSPVCQGQSTAESGNVSFGVGSPADHAVLTNAQDDSSGTKASMPDVIGPSAFLSKIPRLQKLDDDDEEKDDDEFGDADYLAASQTSLASSLGILNDSDILDETCLFPEGFAAEAGHLQGQSEVQPEQEPCLTEVSVFSDMQLVRRSADRSDEVVSRGCADEPMPMGDIATADGVVSDDVLHVEMEGGHSTEFDLTETSECLVSSSRHLDSATEHLKAEEDESLSDFHYVQSTDRESCAKNTFLMDCLDTNEENVTTRDMETSDLTSTVEKLYIDSVGNEDIENNDDDDRGSSKIVVQVELERQLVDRQEHRLSYDDPFDVGDQLCKQVSSEELVDEASSGHKSSEVSTPDKENSSAVLDKTHRLSIGHEQTPQELQKTTESVGNGGEGGSILSKSKLIKTIQSRQLSTLDEKNEDLKQTVSDGKVEKEPSNRPRRGEVKRQPSMGRPQVTPDTEKTSVKGISSLHQNLGRVKSFDASSQKAPAIITSRIVPSPGENAGGLLSVNRLRRNRVASLDLGNTSSSSSASSLKRIGMRRETLKETSVCKPKTERGNSERQEIVKTQTVTATAAKKHPSLLLHLNSSFTAGKTYAVVKNNKTPSDSNLCGSEMVVSGSSLLSRRTSTPLPSAEDPASCSSSMSLENSRSSFQEKQQLTVSANKIGSKKQPLVISSKSKITNAGKPGQLKPKIGKRNEKNSDGRPNSRQEQEWHLQQHHQPDLVPDKDAKDREMDEIIRLEKLSQSHLQQLSCLNTELQCRTKWFQALVIVVQQLSQRLDLEEQSGLKHRLNESLEQLDSMKKQLQELTTQRDALINEIQSVKEEEEQQKETLKREHRVQLSDLKEALQMQHDEQLHRAFNDHSRKIAALEVLHQQQVSELKAFHEKILATSQEDHMSSLKAQKSEHDSNLQELKKQQSRQLDDITLRFEHIKLSLSDKVECLRSECEEMRRREATYMESCQVEMEQKLQLALMPYRHLPQEIESLTAVLELRNLELHNLRHHDLQLQRQVEELPAAQETVKKLEQKVENLEAVIKIRTDYERQLSEKHQQLLRRYDRESKANKRLSMDKEELLWRLSSSQAAESEASSPSFDAFQRSLSHSLANDSDCTGGINPGSDTRIRVDLSESVSETASSSTSPIVSRIQRSGTYDLLCDALDDENTKGSRLSPSE